MQVKSYDLFLDVDFQNLRFDGRVLIELESEGDVTLNSLDLAIRSIRAGGKALQFEQKGEDLLIKTGAFAGTLEIEYTGSIPDSLVGIYRAPYESTHMITTQFEAASARRMLPCVDHPAYKAEFKLTLRLGKELEAISNMPVESVKLEGDRKIVSFQKTPRMSTYLLYLGVGKFEEVQEKLGNIDVIVATKLGQAAKGNFALDAAKRAIELFEDYFGIPYLLPKVHLVAVPEFAAGAMENWGAITFREAALLVDEKSSVRTRRTVAEIVVHELAHMWFGNLVTMKWWNDLWLNESFATFMAYKTVDAMYPDWRSWEEFLKGETSGAMARDSLVSTHPVEVEVKSPDEIEQIFDEISYGKGACILRMIEAYMGADDFRNGVRDFLARYKFANAAGDDLWDSLEKVSGKRVRAIMREWVRKPGYPVIAADKVGGELRLRQERFLLSGASEKGVWPIPVTMRLDSQLRRMLLDKDEETIDIEGAESLKLNVDQTGFYRVHYRRLRNLVWRGELSQFDRWGMVFDALAFVVAGKMSFTAYLSLLRGYYREGDYLPAREVSDQLAFLCSLAQSRFSEVSREFHRSQLKILEEKTDESSAMLRGVVAGRLAMVDEEYAKRLGSEFKDYDEVDPNMKDAVATAYARGYSDFEGLVKRYRASQSDEDRVRLLSSMTSFKEASLVALALGLALSGEVKRQDVRSLIFGATMNPGARDVTWTWLKVNLGRLGKLYEGTGALSRVFQSAIPLLGIGRVKEVERFFDENRIPGTEKGIDSGLERLRIYDRFIKSLPAA